MDAVPTNFLNEQITVAAGASTVWYPKCRYLDVTIGLDVTSGATAKVEFSVDSQAVVESGSGVTWYAASTDLTDQTADISDRLIAPVTALKFTSTADTTTFQLSTRPL